MPGAAEAAGPLTAAQAKALVEGLVEAARAHDLNKFVTFLDANARIAVGPPNANPPLFERLDMRHFEEALRGCTILSVSAGSATTVSIETRCGARNGSRSYIVLRNGKAAIFYPFRPPAGMRPPG
jgi:hypothetical protein